MLKNEEELCKFLSYCYSLVQKCPLVLILKYTKRTGAKKKSQRKDKLIRGDRLYFVLLFQHKKALEIQFTNT